MANTYQGYEVQKHRVLMTVKMYLQIALVCLFLQFVLFLVLIHFHFTFSFAGKSKTVEFVPELHRELLWKWPLARLASDPVVRLLVRREPSFSLHAPGRLAAWPHAPDGTVVMGARELSRVVDYGKVAAAARLPALVSLLAWLLCPFAFGYFHRATSLIKDNRHVRGAELITEEEICAQNDQTGILPVGRIIVSESLSRRHLLIAGQTGAGKSTVLIQHLAAIQGAKRRAIVNDFKGELVEKFYGEGQDFILNPLDARGIGWTLFNELYSKPDLTAVTGSLIPPAKGEDRFWSAAAQDVLRGVMAYCYENNKRSNAELWKALTSPIKEVTEMCQATPSGQAGFTYIQDSSSKQALGIIAVLMSYVSWLEFASDGPFSLREWASGSTDNVIFITNTDEVSNIMRPYLSLFADLAGKRLLALPESTDPERNIYLILDELGNMQRLPSVKRLFTAGRSKGVVMEVGIPDFASIQSVYGREDAHTIINSCGSKLIMNLGDPEAARFFSELAGEEEYWESATYYSISQNEHHGGENHNRQIKARKVVLPAEIMRLPIGEGFFMLPGGNPALVRVPWSEANRRNSVAAPFILRPGLSLDELEAKDSEVTLLAQNVIEGPLPDELRSQVTQNLLKRQTVEEAEETTPVSAGTDAVAGDASAPGAVPVNNTLSPLEETSEISPDNDLSR